MTTRPSKTASGYVDYVPDWHTRQYVLKKRVSAALVTTEGFRSLRMALHGAAYQAGVLEEEQRKERTHG